MRIKVTEKQYALLNEYVNGAKNISEGEVIDTKAFDFVHIDNKIADKIKSLLQYIPDVNKEEKGLDSLVKRLKYLSNPSSSGSLGSRINSLYILTYLEKIRDEDLFEASAAGFFFESFIAGLLNGDREDTPGEAKGAADIMAGGDKFSLKLYSEATEQIQIKSKDQSPSDITDYAIVGIKYPNNVKVFIKKTKGMSPELEENNRNKNICFSTPIHKKVKNDKGVEEKIITPINDRKWYITQSNITNNADRIVTLDYNVVKEKIEEANDGILCIIREMEKQMNDLKNNVETMLMKSGKGIGTNAEKAKGNAQRLDNLNDGSISCDVKSDKKGLIDKSVDVLTKSAEAQSN